MPVTGNSATIDAFHLASNPAIYEPNRRNAFRFVVAGLDSLGIDRAQEFLEFSVVSVDIPHFTQETVAIRRGNATMNAAGVPSFGTSSVVINDYMGADGKSILLEWQRLSYDVRTQTVGLMSDYKKTAWLLEYTPDYSRVLRQWVLYGCWVSGLSEDGDSYDDGGKKTVTATITYDWAEPQEPEEAE